MEGYNFLELETPAPRIIDTFANQALISVPASNRLCCNPLCPLIYKETLFLYVLNTHVDHVTIKANEFSRLHRLEWNAYLP